MKARNIFSTGLLLTIIAGAVFLVVLQTNGNFRYQVQSFLGIAPCQKPIRYSIGSLDPRFGLSRTDLVSALSEAAAIWNKPLNKTLLTFDQTGSLRINLVYDYRQKATADMQKLSPQIDQSRASYDSLKTEYNSLKSQYTSLKSAVDQEISAFNAKQAQYESQVQYWNSKGGAPKSTYENLLQTRTDLETQSAQISRDQARLNALIDQINSLVDPLNAAAKAINAGVTQYNEIGQSTGSEFDEGLYISDASGTRINIFQFSTKAQLVRVLAHEFGHALGLDHISDPNAIMYELNQSKNLNPTTSDLSELKVICHAN